MKRIAQAPNIAIAQLWLDHLLGCGVQASLQRRFTSSTAGDMPPDQCLPEVWVQDDAQLERAKTLLAELQNTTQRRWQSSACGEPVEGGFEACWSCGAWMRGVDL